MRPGAKPSFGVARPMQGGDGKSSAPPPSDGGEQFPPLPGEDATATPDAAAKPQKADAMTRLSDRMNQVHSGESEAGGFEQSVHKIKEQVLPRLLERVDPEAAATLSKEELAEEFRPIIMEVLAELKITLNRREQFALEKVLIDELLGFGPLEELLGDPDISDIMVNGPDQTYIEKGGKLVIAPIRFRDEQHLFQIAQRIVNQVGRRVDQTTPLADARLKDGSRVNVIVPPLSLRGTAISIRKFSEKPITLDMLMGFGSMNDKMCTALKIAGACRMNIVISGGTGSGKTTMLNALSKMIDPGERVLTIEDAAELAPAAAALAAAGNAPAEPRRTRRHHHRRSGQERPAHAARPHHPGRDSRRGMFRPSGRHEHRPRRLHVYASRQLRARMPGPYGKHDFDGRHQDPEGSHQPPDCGISRPDRAGQALCATVRAAPPASPKSSAWKAMSS